MRTFDDIMNDPKNHIRLKMQPGKGRVWRLVGCRVISRRHGHSEEPPGAAREV